ncbi:MAG TPA: serine hydrolase domain-containing protein [Methylomirabilota bacterium]|jgi:CubicO group peptidase (beta-lactamase class C family)|nr:serine hydrolase domain-containing protein [Methylomirabilota bacterium]
MPPHRLVCAALVVLTLLAVIGDAAAQSSLNPALQPYLAKYELPALGAAVVKSGKIVASGAVGTRKAGAAIPVGVNDRFHLGSDTKAMTALLAGMLVEEGRIRWNSPLAEVFPELAEKMTPGLRRVTLEQLLSHTSGIPADNEAFADLLGKSSFQDGNLDDLRYWLLQQWSTQPLEAEPGARFAFSTMGYTIAGAMMERVTGKTWEEMITERIFVPLRLKTAGLGPQATLGRIDAPLGHARVNGKLKAFLAGPDGDNPPIIGPAGLAHMSVLDFARWAGWNAGEGRRGPKLVQPETLRKLHAPVVAIPERKDAPPGTPTHGKYALGWAQVSVDWAPESLIHHGGSNQKNLAHIWVAPRRDFAMVIVTNVATPGANDALLGLASALYTKYAPADRPARR